MLILPKGLLNRKHEYVLAAQIDVTVPGKEEPDRVLTVLNNHNNPLRCTPADRDFVIERLIDKLKKDLPKRNSKVVDINIVDLGPVGSAYNWANKKKFVDHGYY